MNPDTMMPNSAAGDSEHFYFAAALLECVACGVIVVLPSGQIISFNNTAEKLLGLRAADVIGHSASVLPPALRTVIEETLAKRRNVPARNVDLSPPNETVLLQI